MAIVPSIAFVPSTRAHEGGGLPIGHLGSVCRRRPPFRVLQNQGCSKKYLRCDRLTPESASLRGSAGQYCRVAISVHMRLQQCYRRQPEIARFERREDTGFVGPASAFVGVRIRIGEDRVERSGVSIYQRHNPSVLYVQNWLRRISRYFSCLIHCWNSRRGCRFRETLMAASAVPPTGTRPRTRRRCGLGYPQTHRRSRRPAC
jgi:hypothetical protein